MKIPLQEKIAELETRIAKLEAKISKWENRTATASEIFESSSWKKMWKHFDEVMEKLGEAFR